MQQELPLIDLPFALAQLSDNHTLMVTMLTRFAADYAGRADAIQRHLDSGNVSAAIIQVHTLKGVTSNLGMRALHQLSKELEQQLKNGLDGRVLADSLANTLQKTLTAIYQLESKNDSAPIANETLQPKVIDSPRSQLITILNRHEFIPPQKLTQLIRDLNIAPDDSSTLYSTINDLDYPAALEILNNLAADHS